MMAIVNYNNDVAEYWEWSDTGYFSVDFTNDAYKLGVNYIIYMKGQARRARRMTSPAPRPLPPGPWH